MPNRTEPAPQKGKQKMKETGNLPERIECGRVYLNKVYRVGTCGPLALCVSNEFAAELCLRYNAHNQMREALKKALPYYKLSAVMGDTINQEIAQTIMDALALATPGKEG